MQLLLIEENESSSTVKRSVQGFVEYKPSTREIEALKSFLRTQNEDCYRDEDRTTIVKNHWKENILSQNQPFIDELCKDSERLRNATFQFFKKIELSSGPFSLGINGDNCYVHTKMSVDITAKKQQQTCRSEISTITFIIFLL